MSQLDPTNTTAEDLCTASLKDCGAFGVGQTPLAEDVTEAKTRLQWMLQQWERKRWFIYHLVSLKCVAQPDPNGVFQGKQAYTVGPGGDFDTNQMVSQFNLDYSSSFASGFPVSVRPNRIESAFARQLIISQPNQPDFWLARLNSREDYDKIALKGLSSFPTNFFYDTAWDMGLLYVWPIPNAHIYEIHISVRAQLPPMFAMSGVAVDIPYEYYNALELQLALRLYPKYGINAQQGNQLQGLARDALNTIRKGNFQIAQLTFPKDLIGKGHGYNIFSDRSW